jgi:hypothetical protein
LTNLLTVVMIVVVDVVDVVDVVVIAAIAVFAVGVVVIEVHKALSTCQTQRHSLPWVLKEKKKTLFFFGYKKRKNISLNSLYFMGKKKFR